MNWKKLEVKKHLIWVKVDLRVRHILVWRSGKSVLISILFPNCKLIKLVIYDDVQSALYTLDIKRHTATILNLSNYQKKNTKIRNSQVTLKRQKIQQQKIADLYEPLIDQAINIEDQLILLTQLLSSSKLSIDIPIDSICILDRAEYLLNLSRNVFRDVSKLLSQIRDFDLSMPGNGQ